MLKTAILKLLIASFSVTGVGYNLSAHSNKNIKLGKLKVIGNKEFSQNQIKDWFHLRKGASFSFETIDQKSVEVLQRLKEEGFYFAKFDSITTRFQQDSSFVDVILYLNEGETTKIRTVLIDGLADEYDEVLGELKTGIGKSFREEKLQHDIDFIISYFEVRGYPYCKVNITHLQVEEVNEKENGIDITLHVDPGPKVQIADIEIRGNEETQDDVILRELGVHQGEIYDQRKIDKIRSRLMKLEYFKWVNPPRIEWTENKTGKLIIELAEGNYNRFNGVMGYNPATATNQGFVTGLIDLSFGNLFGTGRQIEAHWQKRTEKTQGLRLRYLEPWIAGIPLNAGASFEQLIQDTIYVQRDLELDLQFRFNENLFFSSRISKRNISPDSLGSVLFGIPSSSSLNLAVGASFNTTDDFINPRKGVKYQTQFEWGRKTVDALTHPTEGAQSEGSFNQKRISIDFENYFSLFRWQVFAIGLHGKQITSDETVVPITEQFRFGGTHSLRGYREEQFRGSRIGWANIEYRYLLGPRSRFFAFIDVGYFFREDLVNTEIMPVKGSKIGYGIGLRIDTKLGFFGIDYGLGEGDGLSDGKVHIALTNTF